MHTMPVPGSTMLEQALGGRGWLLLDGGLASELARRGADLRGPLWSAQVLIDQPRLVREVHLAYLRAGARILITASYQASLEGLRRQGLSGAAAAGVLRDSVRLAREAAAQFAAETAAPGSPALVAASIGPYGAFLHDGSEYRGDYRRSPHELKAFHRPRLEILLECAPDLIACETIPSRREAAALGELLDELGVRAAWCSFSCADQRHLCDGEPFRAALHEICAVPAIAAAGINCTAPRHVAGLLESLGEPPAQPLIVYPNSGEHWDAAAGNWIGEGDPIWEPRRVWRWHAAGARIFGGCCRTTPDDIRRLGEVLHAGPR